MYKKCFTYPPTFILRHRRENLKKCSLSGLESRPDLIFLTYPTSPLPPLHNLCVLTLDAPLLSPLDAHLSLFLIDGTWKHSSPMLRSLPPPFLTRSLPSTLRTAYPRRQLDCPDPKRGLASIEALYAAYILLNRPTSGLLDLYYWKESFLSANNTVFT